MRFKKLGIALAACAALGAILASSAFAGTAVTDPSAWVQTNGGVAETIGEENIICRHTEEEGKLSLTGLILGSEVVKTATGISCSGMKLITTGSGEESMAIFEGSITLTGVTVDQPASCKTPPSLTTNPLVAYLRMDETETAKMFMRVVPKAGETFTNIKLEGCAIAGTYPLKGEFYGEATHPTGVHTVNQHFAANATTAAMSTFRFGNKPAILTGEFEIELENGLSWGAEGL